MSMIEALILGVIQGLTEFLPVSSSGHLIIFQRLFGLEEPDMLFNVSAHVGTLLAVVVIYWRDIWSIAVNLFKNSFLLLTKKIDAHGFWANPDARLGLMIIIGSVPTAIIGLFFHTSAKAVFSSMILVGCALLVTGTVLIATKFIQQKSSKQTPSGLKEALIIGTVQGLAVIPGISRSGSTIAAGLFSGLDRETAARYSFLLSIPAIVGAELISLKDAFESGRSLDLSIIAGTAAAFIIGCIALLLLIKLVKQGRLYLFAPYCFFAGVASIFYGVFF